MRYVNEKTGAVIDISCVISGGGWQAEEPASAPKKKKTKAVSVQQQKGDSDEGICDS